jgi:putative membrane protein
MIALLCVAAAVVYWLGGRRPLRLLDERPRWGARQWRTTAFLAGLLVIGVGVSGPVDASVRQAFWSRTAQLIVLVMVAGPLLVLGAPVPRLLRLLGSSRRGPIPAPKLGAIVAFTLFNGALLLAYVPRVYTATASPGWARQIGQLTLVLLGFFFWAEVITQPPRSCGLSHVGRACYLLLSSAQVRILGLVLGFASTPFYGAPLVDQQIAAGILLVPGVLTDLIVLTVCLYLWLGQDDHRQRGRFDSGGTRLRAFG